MRQRFLLVILLLPFLPASCSSDRQLAEISEPDAQLRKAATGEAPSTPPSQRMIIQKVGMELIVKDAPAAAIRVKEIVSQAGGYVATSSSHKEDGEPRVSFTVRVPADKLELVLRQFRALALDIESENVSGEDVTEQYFDLQANLRNEQAYEKELLSLLAETRQRTGKAEDILAVYNQVKESRGRIEQMQARSQYLEKMSSLATIDLQLTPSALSQPIGVAGWHPTGTIREAIRALLRGLQILADIAIILVIVVLPLLLLIALPIYALGRLYRRLRRKRLPVSAAPLA